MFAALLFPEIKKSKNILLISLIAVIVYVILFYSKLFSSGWDIIVAVIISSLLGLKLINNSKEEL